MIKKWAKLLTIDLYNKDVISPFIYKKFNVNGVSLGLENFILEDTTYLL